MKRDSRIGILLIELSVLPFMMIGIVFLIGLLSLLVLEPFGIPAAPQDRAFAARRTLEIVLGIQVILVVGGAGIFVGVLLWSTIVNLLSLDRAAEQTLRDGGRWDHQYRDILLWGLARTRSLMRRG